MAMIRTINNFIIPAAMSLLPAEMDISAARAFLLAITLQESKATYRQQINGPARGLWEFEINGVEGVRTHRKTANFANNVLTSLLYRTAIDNSDVLKAIEHNDILACCFARLLIYTIPAPLPLRTEYDSAWGQYLAAWRPGKPDRARWNVNYTMAWQENFNAGPIRRA